MRSFEYCKGSKFCTSRGGGEKFWRRWGRNYGEVGAEIFGIVSRLTLLDKKRLLNFVESIWNTGLVEEEVLLL